MIDLSISIVSYNTKDLLKQCIESIYTETKCISFEVFVVDNASSDGTIEMIQNNLPAVKLIANKKNVGFAAANNQAIKAGKGRYFLLLNPDTIVLDSSIDKLVEFMDSHPAAGVVGPQVLNPDGTVQFSCDDGLSLKFYFRDIVLGSLLSLLYSATPSFIKNLYRRYAKHANSPIDSQGTQNRPAVKEVGRVRGACFVVRRDAVNQVGLMDEQFFLYSEESDWEYRIRKAGWKIYFFPFARIIHYRRQSTNQIGNLSLIIARKSSYKYLRKHYGNYAVLILRSMLLMKATFDTIRLLRELLRKSMSLKEVKHQLWAGWKAVWMKYKDNQDAGEATEYSRGLNEKTR